MAVRREAPVVAEGERDANGTSDKVRETEDVQQASEGEERRSGTMRKAGQANGNVLDELSEEPENGRTSGDFSQRGEEAGGERAGR